MFWATSIIYYLCLPLIIEGLISQVICVLTITLLAIREDHTTLKFILQCGVYADLFGPRIVIQRRYMNSRRAVLMGLSVQSPRFRELLKRLLVRKSFELSHHALDQSLKKFQFVYVFFVEVTAIKTNEYSRQKRVVL